MMGVFMIPGFFENECGCGAASEWPWHSLAGAAGVDRTLDLTLTKGALYH